jgi:hypothetical protein
VTEDASGGRFFMMSIVNGSAPWVAEDLQKIFLSSPND